MNLAVICFLRSYIIIWFNVWKLKTWSFFEDLHLLLWNGLSSIYPCTWKLALPSSSLAPSLSRPMRSFPTYSTGSVVLFRSSSLDIPISKYAIIVTFLFSFSSYIFLQDQPVNLLTKYQWKNWNYIKLVAAESPEPVLSAWLDRASPGSCKGVPWAGGVPEGTLRWLS